MAIEHIVLFKFKRETTKADIQKCFVQLEQLSKQLPAIQSYQSFQYESNEELNQGYTHGFTMEFNTSKDRDDYLNHPNHLEVKKFITPMLDDSTENGSGVIAFDFNKKNLIHNYKKPVTQSIQFDGANATLTKNLLKATCLGMAAYGIYTFFASSSGLDNETFNASLSLK